MNEMPWIDKDKCTGCEVCLNNCPVDAISIKKDKAEINMDLCIRCGTCHEVCPQDAVRHDSEKIPQEVEENIKWVKELMKHHKTEEERKNFLKRMKNYFNKEKKVATETIEKIESL